MLFAWVPLLHYLTTFGISLSAGASVIALKLLFIIHLAPS